MSPLPDEYKAGLDCLDETPLAGLLLLDRLAIPVPPSSGPRAPTPSHLRCYAGFDRNPWLLRDPGSAVGREADRDRESLQLRPFADLPLLRRMAAADEHAEIAYLQHVMGDDVESLAGTDTTNAARFRGFDVGSYRFGSQGYSSIWHEAAHGIFPDITALLASATSECLFPSLDAAHEYLRRRIAVRAARHYALESERLVAMVPVAIWEIPRE
jgi:hypothetical protein